MSLPYLPNQFDKICFSILADGSTSGPIEPQPRAKNALEALDEMPPGSGFRALRLAVPDPAMPESASQFSDVQSEKTLRAERDLFPTLWLRGDVDLPLNDLESYTQLAKYSVLETLDAPREEAVDAAVLVSPNAMPCQLPALQRRA